MMNGCEHECARSGCGSIFTHAPACEEGYHARLCTACEREGWVLRECATCHEWTALLKGWACADCIQKRRIVA